MSLQVHLRRQAGHIDADPTVLKRLARAVLRGEGIERGAVTIVLTDDASIRSLNDRYRGKDRPTDVLAFPLEGDEEGTPYLGDVVISVERALVQAPRFRNDPEAELARLLVHGLLHLLGYDHHVPSDGKRMKAAERRGLRHFAPGTLARTKRELA